MQSIPAGADQRGALLINAMTIDGLPHYYVTVHLASGIFARSVGSGQSLARRANCGTALPDLSSLPNFILIFWLLIFAKNLLIKVI